MKEKKLVLIKTVLGQNPYGKRLGKTPNEIGKLNKNGSGINW